MASVDNDRMGGIMRTRRGALVGLAVAAVLGAVHIALGGGLPLWVYVLSVAMFGQCFLAMEFLRRSAARKTQRAEPKDEP